MAIQRELITEILLHDGWHDVEIDSFRTEDYEILGGGGTSDMGTGRVESTGFIFNDHRGQVYAGSMIHVLALRLESNP